MSRPSRDAGATPERRVLVSTESPPLREIATVLMKVSQNLYAETLLKAIGAARGGARHGAGAGRRSPAALRRVADRRRVRW